MSEKVFGQNDPKIAEYVEALLSPEDEILKKIRKNSDTHGLPPIQVGPVDGRHLTALTRVCNAKKIVEIGTLGGYSGVCMLRGLQPGGKLYTFEYEPKHAQVARESFKLAGFENQFEIHVGAALDNLPKIEKEGPFDLVFIDADKENYPNYLNWAYENLRTGGVVLGDNTFAWGAIADETFESKILEKQVKAFRKFNETLAQSDRFLTTVWPTGEGLTMGIKIK